MSKTIISELLEEAWNKRREGDYQTARELVNEALKICPENEFDLLGRIYHMFMQFDRDNNQFKEALQWNRKSLLNYEKTGNPAKIAHSIRHLADLQQHLGQLAQSKLNYLKALDIYRNQPQCDSLDVANALRSYALLMEKMNVLDEAITTWQEAKELYRATQIQAGVDEADNKLRSLQSQ